MLQINDPIEFPTFRNLPNETLVKWKDEVWYIYWCLLIQRDPIVFDDPDIPRLTSRKRVYINSKYIKGYDARPIKTSDFSKIRNEDYKFWKKLLKSHWIHSSILAFWDDGYLHSWQEAEWYWIDLWAEWDAYYYKSYPNLIWRFVVEL